MRSIKSECLNRMIFLGEWSLRHAVKEYMTHYHAERNHQGMGNRLLKPITAACGSRKLIAHLLREIFVRSRSCR